MIPGTWALMGTTPATTTTAPSATTGTAMAIMTVATTSALGWLLTKR
jgi:hypothetical protein